MVKKTSLMLSQLKWKKTISNKKKSKKVIKNRYQKLNSIRKNKLKKKSSKVKIRRMRIKQLKKKVMRYLMKKKNNLSNQLIERKKSMKIRVRKTSVMLNLLNNWKKNRNRLNKEINNQFKRVKSRV